MLDLLIVLVILVFVLIGAKKGLIQSLMGVFNFVFALFFTRLIYPVVTKVLLSTDFIYTPIKDNVSKTLDIEKTIKATGDVSKNEIINSFEFPDAITKMLKENNNPEIYKILEVNKFETYLESYLTNFIISIIASIIVFIIAFAISSFIIVSINLVTKLPVVSGLNYTVGGSLLGFVKAIILIWIVMIALSVLISKDPNCDFAILLKQSNIGLFLYNNNIIFNLIKKVVVPFKFL